MPEEAAEPAVLDPNADLQSSLPTGFGNVTEAFDKAFKVKAEDKPATPPPVAPAPAQPAPAAPAPVPEGEIQLPSEIFGEPVKKDEPVVATEKKEYDAPEQIKKDPKAYANWNELRAKHEQDVAELTKEVSTWKEKAESVKPDEALKARNDELEALNKEYSDRIALVDIQTHPEYQRRFVQQRNGIIEGAVEIARDAGLDVSALREAMNLTGATRVRALDDILESIESPTVKGDVQKAISQVNELDRMKALTLAKAATNMEQLRKEEAIAQQRSMTEGLARQGKLLDGIVKQLGDKKMPFFMRVEGNDAWNQELDADIAMARKIALESSDEVPMIGSIIMGVRGLRMQETVIAQYRTIGRLQKELSQYKSAEPNLNGQRTDEPGAGAGDEKLSFAAAAAKNSGLS